MWTSSSDVSIYDPISSIDSAGGWKLPLIIVGVLIVLMLSSFVVDFFVFRYFKNRKIKADTIKPTQSPIDDELKTAEEWKTAEEDLKTAEPKMDIAEEEVKPGEKIKRRSKQSKHHFNQYKPIQYEIKRRFKRYKPFNDELKTAEENVTPIEIKTSIAEEDEIPLETFKAKLRSIQSNHRSKRSKPRTATEVKHKLMERMDSPQYQPGKSTKSGTSISSKIFSP